MYFDVNYNKNTFTWDFIRETKSNDNKTTRVEVAIVRDAVMHWIDERFFHQQKDLNIFYKCMYLFDRDNLFNVLSEYRDSLCQCSKHWITYIHTLSAEFLTSFSTIELENKLSENWIDWYGFITRVLCISGAVEIVEQKDDCDIKEIVDGIGDFCGGVYLSETSKILSKSEVKKLLNDKDKLMVKVIDELNSSDLPTIYVDPLMFDRFPEECFKYLNLNKISYIQQKQ